MDTLAPFIFLASIVAVVGIGQYTYYKIKGFVYYKGYWVSVEDRREQVEAEQKRKEHQKKYRQKKKDVNLKITEIYQDFKKKIEETDDGKGVSLTYWYDIIKKRVSYVPLRKDSSFDLQVKELVYGNYDEYKRRDDLIDTTNEKLESFARIRIFSFGEIYSQLILLEKKINELLSNNSIKTHKITEQLNNELAQAKSGVYGAIKYALSVNISKNKIKEWFPGFLDDKELIEGINLLDSIAKKYNIDMPSSTPQYELSEEEKDNIPDWYTGTVYDEGTVIKDKETGKEIKLTGLETSIYQFVKVNNAVLGEFHEILEIDKADKSLYSYSTIYHDMIEELNQGKLWLKENNLKAYKVLFGEPEEDNYKKGKPEGISKTYYESGELKQELNYKKGKKEGITKGYYESGELMGEGKYKKGKLEGISKTYYESGELKQELNYKNGKKEGIGKKYYESGELKGEVNYKKGKPEGIEKYYYESGELKQEFNSKNGKLEGISKGYYESGELKQELNYKNGKLEGIEKYYYDSGQLAEELNYKNGKMEGTAKKYYESGELKQELNYKKGKLEGIGKTYYESGELKGELNYKNGKLEGIEKYYYESGKVIMEDNYKKGKLEGTTKNYYESGQLMGEVNYKNGKIVSEKSWDEDGNEKN